MQKKEGEYNSQKNKKRKWNRRWNTTLEYVYPEKKNYKVHLMKQRSRQTKNLKSKGKKGL
jgi:hypothetical protein